MHLAYLMWQFVYVFCFHAGFGFAGRCHRFILRVGLTLELLLSTSITIPLLLLFPYTRLTDRRTLTRRGLEAV